MAQDPVPELLARATEVLEAEFGALPPFEPSPACRQAMARVLDGDGAPAGR